MEQDAALLALIESGLSHCRAVVVEDGSLLISLFMAGLVGGLTHCTGMCGPFVLSQVTARLEATPAREMREWHRLSGAALAPYHLGRLTTYVILGTVAASLASSLMALGGLKWVSAGLLMLAAILFVGYAVPRLRVSVPGGAAAEGWWSARVGRVARPLFSTPTGWRGYALGVLLGFIPCGLLYGALLAASGTGDPLAGALGMAAFALGTVPSLFGVGLMGHLAAGRWRHLAARIAPMLLIFNAGVLAWLAVEQII